MNTPIPATQTAPAARVRRQPRAVRWHERNKQWTVSIGKAVSRDGTCLRPKDFYFTATEADANTEANRLQAKWAFIVGSWGKLYRPTLERVGSKFAAVPHWEPAMGKTPTVAEIAEAQDQPPTSEEIAEAYQDATLQTVWGLYQLHLKSRMAMGEIRNTTVDAIRRRVAAALQFFPDPLRIDALTLAVLTEAKGKMLNAVGRKTAKNRLGELKVMLKWFYDGSDYGRAHEKPTAFDSIFSVTDATRTDVKTHSAANLKTLMGKASDRTRLYILLALNCGMYQSDVGHLTLDEINLTEGYVFWDREKEPTNPFRVRHDLWPETLAAVKRYIQPADAPKRTFIDYRNGKATAVDCSRLAFVDLSGNPLYQVRENGTQYEKITEAWRELKRKYPNAPRYRDIRKSTNQALCDLLHGDDETDPERMIAVGEISSQFLSQRTPLIARLYKTSGQRTYQRMNRFLRQVGDYFRAQSVFDCL